MRRWKHVAVRVAHCDAKCVANRSVAERFVVANEAWKNRETGGIRARPALGPPGVRIERKNRARSRFPLRAVPAHRVELVIDAVVAIDDQHVPVAVRIRIVAGEPALDPLLLRLRFLRNRIWTGIALVVEIERDGYARLRTGHDDVRKSVDRR